MTKTVKQAKEFLKKDNDNEQSRLQCVQLTTTLQEELEILKTLDKQILELIENDDDIGEQEICDEIEQAGCLRSEHRSLS